MHNIASNKGACPTKPCAAMDRHRLPSIDVALCYLNEFLDDRVFWATAVGEFHLVDLDALSLKLSRLIKLIVQSNNSFYFRLEEVAHEVTRADHLGAVPIIARGRRGKCNDLARNNPA